MNQPVPNPIQKNFDAARERLLENLQERVIELQDDIRALCSNEPISGKWAAGMLGAFDLLILFVRYQRLVIRGKH